MANDSRIPRWFVLAPEQRRSDVTVHMTYYISLTGDDPAEFVLRDRDGRLLAKVDGKVRDDQPQSVPPAAPKGPLSYPVYEVVTANGITEVIEHRKKEDDMFFVTDDVELKRKLRVVQ